MDDLHRASASHIQAIRYFDINMMLRARNSVCNDRPVGLRALAEVLLVPAGWDIWLGAG